MSQVFPNWVSGHYRFENDDGTIDTSTFIAAEDTPITQDTGETFRIRYNWGESAGQTRGSGSIVYLQYNINGGSWVTVGAATAVKYATGGDTDGDTSTTERLTTAPTGCATYIDSEYDSDNTLPARVPIDSYFEVAFNIEIDAAQVADEDTINFQILGTSAWHVVDTTPSLTVNEVGGATQTITDLPFISSTTTVHLPTVKSIYTFVAAFIVATSQLFLPDVLASTYTITDTPFINNTTTVHLPTVTGVGGTQTITDLPFISTGSSLHEPTVQGPATSIARYKLDEASSGQVPTTCTDDTGNSNTLTIDYDTDQLFWNSIAAGNGLDFAANDHTATVKLDDISTNGNIGSELDSVTEASLVLRLNMLSGDVSANRAFYIGLTAGNSDFSFNLRPDIIEVRWNEEIETDSRCQYTLTMPTGVKTIGITVDTTESTQGDRVKLYLDGVLQTTKVLDNIVLDSALTGVNSTLRGICLGNRNNGARGGDADIYYAELFTGKLTAAQHSTAHTNLTKTNESDWATVQFIDLPFISTGSSLHTPDVTAEGASEQTITDLPFISSTTTVHLPVVGIPPWYVTGHSRYENDDGDVEASTFIAAEDTAITQLVNSNFRLRFNWGSKIAKTLSDIFRAKLTYSINSGAWVTVSATSAVQYALSVHDFDGRTTAVSRLASKPTGTVLNSGAEFDEAAPSGNPYSIVQHYIETVFNILIDPAQVSDGDTIEFRIENANLGEYQVRDRDTTPSLTVEFDQTIIPQFISAGSSLHEPSVYTDQIISLGFISSTSALHTPTINTTVNLGADFIGSTSALHDPTLTGSLTITDVGFISSTTTVHLPTVSSTYTITDLGFISSTSQLHTPDVSGALIIEADFIGSTSQLYTPDFTGTFTIPDVDFIGSTASLHLPTVSSAYTIEPVFIASTSQLYAPSVLASTYTITDLGFISSTSQLHTPDFAGSLTIPDVDFISSTSQLHLPTVTAIVPGQVDCPFIPSGSSLHEPSVYTDQIIEPSFIGSTSALHEPSFSTAVNLGADFIGSTSQLHTPAVGNPPFYNGANILTPRVEGDIVSGLANFWMSFSGGTTPVANVGDTPPDLTYSTIGNSIGNMNDQLSDTSAGTYTIQFSSTNSYGTTFSPEIEFVVKERIQPSFISSTTSLHEPSVSGADTIVPEFIASTASLYLPVVTPQAVTLGADYIPTGYAIHEPNVVSITTVEVGFISSTTSLHVPVVYDASFQQNYEVVEFTVKISQSLSDDYNVTKTDSGDYKITRGLSDE
jgi:hypothetical protein